MHLFDTHAHLTDARFSDDLPHVLSRAIKEGVNHILIPSSNVKDALSAIEIATRYSNEDMAIYCAVGVHPHDASTLDISGLNSLRQWIKDKKRHRIVAVGEIGLDYHYDYSPRKTQQEAFKQQMDLAYEYQCPVIIHEREATEDMLNILRDYYKKNRLMQKPGVFHCFSGSLETAIEVIEMGFLIGFDGPITFKNNRKSLEIIERISEDKLLIETDCPYLTPEPFRGKRNEPAYIKYILDKMAEIKGISSIKMAEKTFKNAMNLFQIEKKQQT